MLPDDMMANTGRASLVYFPLAWLRSPGFAVVTAWRLAKRLNRGGAVSRLLAIIVRRYFVNGHGCDISLTATIGAGLRLPHAPGIVIGAGTVIGNNVAL